MVQTASHMRLELAATAVTQCHGVEVILRPGCRLKGEQGCDCVWRAVHELILKVQGEKRLNLMQSHWLSLVVRLPCNS